MRERYGDDPSTHPKFDPNLWIEVGSSGGLDKNRVYELSNTTTENLWATRSVSIVGSSQSVSSTQSKEFVALLQHTTHLTEKLLATVGELWITHDSSHREIQATLGELWTTSPNGHEHDITEWWYMWAFFWPYGPGTTCFLHLLL